MTTLRIADQIRTSLPASLLENGRIALTITVNVPAGDVQFYGAYNAGGVDRGFVDSENNRP